MEERRRGKSITHNTPAHGLGKRGRGQQQGASQWQHYIRQKKRVQMVCSGQKAAKHPQGYRALAGRCEATLAHHPQEQEQQQQGTLNRQRADLNTGGTRTRTNIILYGTEASAAG